MEAYREFKKEVIEFPSKWELIKQNKVFSKLYLKFMYRTRLICRVLMKLSAYKRQLPTIQAVETIVKLDEKIEVVNTIRKAQRSIYSLEIKCKFQIHDWALDIVGLMDTGCSNTVLDQKLVSPQYHKPISPAAKFTAEQMDGKLFTYTTKLDRCKVSFYPSDGKLTNYIHVDN